jgi:membrane protein DedA with SNARE-associated domain
VGYNKTISPQHGVEVQLHGIEKTLLAFGPAGVFALAVLDSVGIPLPDGVDLLVVLFSALNPSGAYLTAAVAVIGSLVGNVGLFYVARRGGQAYLERKTASEKSEKAAKFRLWFQRYGLLTVFIPLLLPVPLPTKIFVLFAGALGVRPFTFLMVVIAARIPRYFGMAYLGSRLGEHSMEYIKAHAWYLVGFAAALFVLLYMLIRLYEHHNKPEPA